MSHRPVRGVLLAAILTALALASPAAATDLDPISGTLTVEKVGNGLVTGSGINCGSTCTVEDTGPCEYDGEWQEWICSEPFASLTASTHNGFVFDHWVGCEPSTSATCSLHYAGETTVTAHFDDVQAPTTSLTEPSTTAARGGTINLAATAGDNGGVSQVEFYVRNSKVGEDTTAPYSLSLNTTGLADGGALVESLAIDSAGNPSTRSGRTITIDNTDPTVSIGAGPNGQTFGPGTTQSFAFSAADGASGVQEVECRIDAGAYGSCSGGTTAHSVSNLPNGPHSFAARVTDNVGRTSEATRSWTIDATGPATSLTKPAAGAKRGTIDLAATATDSAGVQRVEFWVGGVEVAEDTTAPYEATYATTLLADGATPAVMAKAYDAFGNLASPSVGITVDNGLPTLSFEAGPDGQTFGPQSTQTWAFTSGDAVSGVALVRCSVDGGAYAGCSDGNVGHSVVDTPGGAHTLDVRVTDAAGNERTVRRTWTIDATGPVVSITSGPADGTTITGSAVTFGFSASEGATYRCRVWPAALTAPAWGDCSAASGHAASGFAPGAYAFEVQGTDQFGNVGTAVKRTFTVPGATGGDTGGETTADGPKPGAPGTTTTTTTTTTTPERVTTPMTWFFLWGDPRGTKVTTLKVGPIDAGVTIALSCKRGCPFKKKAVKVKGRYVELAPLFKKKLLRPGTVFEVTMSKPGAIAKTMRFTTVKGKKPKVKAL